MSNLPDSKELRYKVERLIGTAILKNDKNYTDDMMAVIEAEISKQREQARQEAKQEIYEKLRHSKPYEIGETVGSYLILDRLPKTKHAKSSPFKVRCLNCGETMRRYPNKFQSEHQDCYPRSTSKRTEQRSNDETNELQRPTPSENEKGTDSI